MPQTLVEREVGAGDRRRPPAEQLRVERAGGRAVVGVQLEVDELGAHRQRPAERSRAVHRSAPNTSSPSPVRPSTVASGCSSPVAIARMARATAAGSSGTGQEFIWASADWPAAAP